MKRFHRRHGTRFVHELPSRPLRFSADLRSAAEIVGTRLDLVHSAEPTRGSEGADRAPIDRPKRQVA
jgi:hypothetical protein